MFLVDYLAEHAETHLEGADFGSAVCVWLLDHAISWTRTRSTLMFFRDTLSETDAQMFHPDMHKIQMEIDQLLGHRTWSFLSMGEEKKEANRDIADCHQECHGGRAGGSSDSRRIPKPVGRQRIVLHAFAGRRRLGDLQYYLERDLSSKASYDFVTVSLDIVINQHCGDATRADTRRLWL